MNKKKVITVIAILAVLAAALFFGRRFLNRSSGGEEAFAYVDIAENYTPFGSQGAAGNYYTGTVAAQETWSVSLDPEAKVKELLVAVGDEVTEGQELFIYDTEDAEAELEQLEIDLVRLNNEQTNLEESIKKLETEKSKTWDSSDKADYDLRIQETELELEEKKLDIEAKKNEIQKKKNSIEHSAVSSKISGVVSRISDQNSSAGFGSDNDNSYITVVKTGDLQIKGSASEMNIWDLSEGMAVIVYSRVDDAFWHGTISKIEYNDPSSAESMNGGEGSTKYPFFVTLDNTDGLMLGQHVYITKDQGQSDPRMQEGIWLYSYMIDEVTDPEHPFVWTDSDGRLEKREVTIGERDDSLGLVQILGGLELTDYVAQPMEGLTEGMKAVTMGEMVSENSGNPIEAEGGEILPEEENSDGNMDLDMESENYEGEDFSTEGEEFGEGSMISGTEKDSAAKNG